MPLSRINVLIFISKFLCKNVESGMAMNKASIPAIILSTALLVTASAIAQKLPGVQEVSVRAPANIKVDGKLTEWNNQFQAYNKATEIFYTISNDDDKLYLTVQATDLDIIMKIIEGGVTLTINGAGKMKDQEGVAITYPVLNKKLFPETGPAINIDKPESWTADSFIVVLNRELITKATDIQVVGVREISNHMLSIYNPEGIKVSALFDNKTVLTYELAVPLKHLGLSVNESLVYNIKLNGMGYDGTFKTLNQGFRHLRTKVYQRLRSGARPALADDGINLTFVGPNVPLVVQMISPTDFWGEYKLLSN